MIRRLFQTQTSTIASAAIILGAASLLSRIIGIIRDRLFAHVFGASATLDVYYAAFRIPDFLFYLVVIGALSAGFIPIFTSLYTKNKEQAWQLTREIMSILSIILLVFSVLLFFCIPFLIPLMVPGFDAALQERTITLTRIMLLSPVFLGLSSVTSGVLQSLRYFVTYAITPIVYNLGIIVGVLFFYPLWGEIGLAFGVVIGAALHFVVQIPALLKKGFRFRFCWNHQDPSVRMIGKLMIPRTLGLAAHQLNWLAMIFFASRIGEGSITVFHLADNLQYAPVGIIGIPFALAAFPLFSTLYAEKKVEEMRISISQTIRSVLFLIIPAMIILLLLRARIVRIFLGSGAFDWDATIRTSDTLAFFVLSLFAQCLIPLLTRVFYAMENTFIPFLMSTISFALNIVLGWYLKDHFGIAGLAFAYSLAMVVQLTLLWMSLRRYLGTLNEATLVPFLYKISIASLAMGLTIELLKEPLARLVDMTRLWGVFTQTSVTVLSGLFVYGIVSYCLQLQELRDFSQSLKRRWTKLRDVHASAPEEIL